VTPQAWKKSQGLIGTDKDAARSRAIQLWPTWKELHKKGKGQALADAALIARRGGEVMSIEAMKQAVEAFGNCRQNGGGVDFYEYAKDLRQGRSPEAVQQFDSHTSAQRGLWQTRIRRSRLHTAVLGGKPLQTSQ
jgi:hypothetical protein